MPSGISMDAPATLTAEISIDAAMTAGVANGASVSPSQARAAKKCRMVNWRFTDAGILHQNEIGKIVLITMAKGEVFLLEVNQRREAALRPWFQMEAPVTGRHG